MIWCDDDVVAAHTIVRVQMKKKAVLKKERKWDDKDKDDKFTFLAETKLCWCCVTRQRKANCLCLSGSVQCMHFKWTHMRRQIHTHTLHSADGNAQTQMYTAAAVCSLNSSSSATNSHAARLQEEERAPENRKQRQKRRKKKEKSRVAFGAWKAKEEEEEEKNWRQTFLCAGLFLVSLTDECCCCYFWIGSFSSPNNSKKN